MSQHKTCKDCRQSFPREEFPQKTQTKNGVVYRGPKARCWDCDRARDRARWEKKKVRQAVYRREKVYGLADDSYQNMLKAQQFRCAICGIEDRLVIDHCHESGKVRGLLCGKCNTGLGQFQDDERKLTAAANYLVRTSFARSE